MKSIKVQVKNENGLTSRLAAELVAEANKHMSKITMIVSDDSSQQADLKSIMNVFTLSIPQNESFNIKIEGPDEEKAFNSFTKLLSNLSI